MRRGRAIRVAAVMVALAVVALAWFRQPVIARATTGAAYGARVACSCRFVAGRSLSSCRDDFEAGMGMVTLSEDAEARSVTARVPLLARQTATFRAGEGCVLEKWSD